MSPTLGIYPLVLTNYSTSLGIPEFWLTIFKNVDMLQEMVQEHDEPVLAALTDVKVTFSDGSSPSHPMVSVNRVDTL